MIDVGGETFMERLADLSSLSFPPFSRALRWFRIQKEPPLQLLIHIGHSERNEISPLAISSIQAPTWH